MTHIKQLSFWAKQHKWASRFIIVFSFIIVNVLGIMTGILFNSLNVTFSSLILVLTILVFLFAFFKYPSKVERRNTIEKNRLYVLQKSCDMVLIVCTFLMFVFFGNHQTSPVNYFVLNVTATNTLTHPKDSTKGYVSVDEFKKMMKDENGKTLKWKERKKLLKKQIKGIKRANDMSEGGKVVLIILCVLLALLLAYVVAGLACTLSCSGSEAAAVIVAIFGFAGIVLLTYFLIRGIVRKSKREKSKEIKPEAEPVNK